MDEPLPKVRNFVVSHPDGVDHRSHRAKPLLDRLIEKVESSTGSDRKRARKELANAMLGHGYVNYRGWMWVSRFFVEIREDREAEAEAWLAERGFARRRSPPKRSRARELGQFFERLGVTPPEELFEWTPRNDARRIGR
jgi:hypothetical protein